MENQPRLPWLRLATLRIAEAESQAQPTPTQPTQSPPPPATRQPTLPVARVPVVPQPVLQSSSPAVPLTQPTSQPMIRAPVLLPTVQPTQPRARPPTPPQQDVPKPAVPTINGAAIPATRPSPPPSPKVVKTSTPTPPAIPATRPSPPPSPKVIKTSTPTPPAIPATRPSPPPSPKVIKTSTPTPPPSPRVKTVPPEPPISVPNNQTVNPEAETKPAPVLSQLKSIAMQEDRDSKVNGNGDSYNNANTAKGANGGGDTDGKMNGATQSTFNDSSHNETNGKTTFNDDMHGNGNGKISNETNGKSTFNDISHNSMNHTPHPERKEIENGREIHEARGKHHHLNSGSVMPNLNHKKSEKDMKIITIAGENMGAIMELGHNTHGYSRKMHQGGHSLTSESLTQDGKATKSRDNKAVTRAKPMTSLVNSNVQSINNSLLFKSSCTTKSPGVHLTFKSKSKGKTHKPGLYSPSS